MSSVALQLRRDSAANCALYTGPQGELVVDTDNRRGLLHDGATQGGFPINGCYGANGSFMQPVNQEGAVETLTTGVSNYTSTLQVPANFILVAVSYVIRTPITGCTQFELGISGTPALFGSGLSPNPGSAPTPGVVLPITPRAFTVATPLLLTSTVGGNFLSGALRFAYHGFLLAAPTI